MPTADGGRRLADYRIKIKMNKQINLEEKWTGLAFVHLFDLQICFVGVFPTRQDLNDNVN